MKHTFKNATEALPYLLDHVLDKGHDTPSRNGTCREVVMQQVTLTEPFPFEITTPGRNGSLPAQIAETMWILAGRNDVDWLSNYLPRAAEFSDDGKVWAGGYGPRLRKWGEDEDSGFPGFDQLAHAVQLLKDEPTTRRAVMQIYDPMADSLPNSRAGKDIPCNNWIHFLPRDGKLHAHIAIRSNDLMWGWSGINHFEWAALQHIVAGLVGMEQGSLTFSISSLHLYEPHWAKAKRIVQGADATRSFGVANDPFDAAAAGHSVAGLDALVRQWFEVEALIRENGPSKQVEYKIDRFPETMLRGWLRVLYSWWHGTKPATGYDTRSSLGQALANSPKRKQPVDPNALEVPELGTFAAFVGQLHREKNAVYGDSWMRRGEMLGIMANLARKIDRLGVPGGGDTASDTAIDLLCYALKYRWWLYAKAGAPAPRGLPSAGVVAGLPEGLLVGEFHADLIAADVVRAVEDRAVEDRRFGGSSDDGLTAAIRELFENMEYAVTEKRDHRWELVDQLILLTAPLAQRLWDMEQTPAQEKGNMTRRWNPEETN